MKKTQIAMLVLAFLAFQGIASAESISGKVVSIDSAAKSLSINQMDSATGAEKKVDLSVSADTAYTGIQAFAELKAGDEISADAQQDAATGSWKATSIKVGKAEEAAAAPAAPAAQ